MQWFLAHARKTLPQLLIAQQQSYRRPHAETVKGVNATERKNYVENKGSYSCFKTFSQLGLRAFNQLFFLLQVLLSAKHLQREKETKEKRENSFSCQSVACKAMKSTLREMSMYYKKGKGFRASSMLKSLFRPLPS